jgi:hypothetical protein
MKRLIFTIGLLTLALSNPNISWGEPVKISTPSSITAPETLNLYIKLRLSNADWKEYSKYITWPDEPGWDCKWAVESFKTGKPIYKGKDVLIPVRYKRLGLYCEGQHFEPSRTEVTITYKLISTATGWKIDSPDIDYPEIDANAIPDQRKRGKSRHSD